RGDGRQEGSAGIVDAEGGRVSRVGLRQVAPDETRALLDPGALECRRQLGSIDTQAALVRIPEGNPGGGGAERVGSPEFELLNNLTRIGQTRQMHGARQKGAHLRFLPGTTQPGG